MPRKSEPAIDKVTVTATVLASWINRSRQRVNQLESEGVFRRAPDGKFPLKASVRAFADFQPQEARKATKAAENARINDAKARALEQRNARLDRELIDIDEHDAVLDEVVGIINAGLVGLPARVTRDRQMRKKIEAEIDRTMNAASARLRQRGEELRATGKASTTEADE